MRGRWGETQQKRVLYMLSEEETRDKHFLVEDAYVQHSLTLDVISFKRTTAYVRDHRQLNAGIHMHAICNYRRQAMHNNRRAVYVSLLWSVWNCRI